MVASGHTWRGEFTTKFTVPSGARTGSSLSFRLYNTYDRERRMPAISAERRVAVKASGGGGGGSGPKGYAGALFNEQTR